MFNEESLTSDIDTEREVGRTDLSHLYDKWTLQESIKSLKVKNIKEKTDSNNVSTPSDIENFYDVLFHIQINESK